MCPWPRVGSLVLAMDVEEPDASQLLSIALNKKNEVAMKTGHLEIMATLVRLCEPEPDGSVPYEPVRDKLIDLYGAAVDHPDFVHVFKLVIDAGGLAACIWKTWRSSPRST